MCRAGIDFGSVVMGWLMLNSSGVRGHVEGRHAWVGMGGSVGVCEYGGYDTDLETAIGGI